MIPIGSKEFIKNNIEKLTLKTVDTSILRIDHIGYQAGSSEDYSLKTKDIEEEAIKVSENIVGGRRVGIFKLNSPIDFNNQKIEVIEIFEPREGQEVIPGWEHVEYLSDFSLEELVSKFEKVDWDKSIMDRDEFPQLVLHLGNSMRAKFPKEGVLDELKRQSNS